MGLMLDLQPSLGRALVVGGGGVATRKVRGLVAAGFDITVVAPAIADAIRALAGVKSVERRFEPSDIDGHALAFACTDDRATNQLIGELARAHGIPVVVADRQAESTAFTPAVHRAGETTIAVSTGGRSPATAAAIRDTLAQHLDSEWQGAPAASRARKRAEQ